MFQASWLHFVGFAAVVGGRIGWLGDYLSGRKSDLHRSLLTSVGT
jgi:hypothetical protein